MTRGVRREGSNRASRRLLRSERFIRGGLGATALAVCESGIGDHLSLSHVDGFGGREAELAGGMASVLIVLGAAAPSVENAIGT